MSDAVAKAGKWISANLTKSATAFIGILLIANPGMIAAMVLLAMGFGEGGIISGSLAAAIHSTIGSVTAQSWFAAFMSTAAKGYGVARVHAAIQAVGGMLVITPAMVASIAKMLKRIKRRD